MTKKEVTYFFVDFSLGAFFSAIIYLSYGTVTTYFFGILSYLLGFVTCLMFLRVLYQFASNLGVFKDDEA